MAFPVVLIIQVILLLLPGSVLAQSRGHLGVIIQTVPNLPEWSGQTQQEGVIILGVMRNSPAEVSGLKRGDIILTFNGQSVRRAEDLQQMVVEARHHDKVEIGLKRRDQTLLIPVKIEPVETPLPADSPAADLPFLLRDEALWAVLVGAGVLLLVVYLTSAQPWRRWRRGRTTGLLGQARQLRIPRVGVAVTVLSLAGVLVVWSCLVVVPPGHGGVVFHLFRGVQNKPLDTGVHALLPGLNRVTLYDTRSRVYHVRDLSTAPQRPPTSGPDQLLWTPTADGLKVGFDLTIRYRIDANRLTELHRSVGPQFEERVVHPVVWNVTRLVASEYSLLDIYGKRRGELQQQVHSRVQSLLARDGLIGEDLLLRDVVYSKEFEKTLVAKMVAEQRVEESDFEVQQAALRARARVLEAQGEAEAFGLVNESIREHPLLLQYLWIKNLPEQVKVMVVPRHSVKPSPQLTPALPETQRAHTGDGEGG